MQQSYLEFDEINHQVVFHQQKLTLNPLSFKLLVLLAEAEQQTVNIETIMQQVWRNGSVTPDTLKQRVFLLRKALTDSGMSGLTVQSVRGEGYRLIIETIETIEASDAEVSALEASQVQSATEPDMGNELAQAQQKNDDIKSSSTTRLFLLKFNVSSKAIALVFCIVIVATSVYSLLTPTQFYANNRIALWSNVEPDGMPKFASDLYGQWNALLLEENGGEQLQLILSERQKSMLVPVQARRDRLALVSYFEVIQHTAHTQVTLNIVEPKTATILFSTQLDLSDRHHNQKHMNKHIRAMKALISSNALHLTKQQKDNPAHQIWAELKALANRA